MPESKTVKESEIVMTELMTPEMANFSGKVHGGTIMSFIDKVAYVCASKYAGTGCITAAVDSISFKLPVEVGELLTFQAKVIWVGRSSMVVKIDLFSVNITANTLKETNTCYATMVAIKDGKTYQVPRLDCQTPYEARDHLLTELTKKFKVMYEKELKEKKQEYLDLSDEEILKLYVKKKQRKK
ncbi:MAG: acyl-CoA thioesterase [Bacteroidetes bacterium]|nr:MAG: acyl-CoA thioesterase [Bacteroidota bacterium]